MPFHWVRIPSSPPRTRLKEVRDICTAHQAVLCGDTIFYGSDNDRAHALIDVSATPNEQALLNALGAFEASGKLSADEKHRGDSLPQSRP